ncbi:MAG: MBL fold metallo-hydrolase [Ferruginibacter sp.]|nr:MBL fold metallo-hydrolase [Ferruginibacter sp.]
MSFLPLTITFLGTGTSSGVPMIACNCEVCVSSNPKDNRLRSSIMVQSATTTIVVDTTPDFRYQMLRQKVKNIDAILFTHPHKDHVAGLDDVKAFNYFNEKAINVYANQLTQKALKNEFYYVFAEHKYPGIPDINLIEITEETFMVGDIQITPIKVMHLHMPVLGFRFGNFTYITDANKIDDTEKQKIVGSQIMVVNALRHKKHLSHFTIDEATSLVEELKIPQAYFTHISHQLGLHDVINKTLNAQCALAYDGLQLNV